MEAESLSKVKSLLFFLCASSPQPEPPSGRFRQLRLFFERPQVIECCAAKCGNFMQLLNLVGFKAYANQSILENILAEGEAKGGESAAYFERLTVQIVVAFLIENANGRFPDSAPLIIRCLLKFWAKRNSGAFFQSLQLLLPYFLDSFDMEQYRAISPGLFQCCFLPTHEFCEIYENLHIILRKLLLVEGTALVPSSESAKLLLLIGQIYETKNRVLPKNEAYELFTTIRPMLYEMNAEATLFFPHIFPFIPVELLAVFFQKYAEATFKYVCSYRPAFELTREEEEVENGVETHFGCFNGAQKGLSYEKPTQKYFEQMPFFEVIKTCSNIQQTSQEVANVVTLHYIDLIQKNAKESSVINGIITFIFLAKHHPFILPEVPRMIFDPCITTSIGREPIFDLIFFLIEKGFQTFREVLSASVNHPKLFAEILHAIYFSRSPAVFIRNPDLLESFCAAGKACIFSLARNNKNLDAWYEISMNLKLILSNVSFCRFAFRNNFFVELIILSFFDNTNRKTILYSTKNYIQAPVIEGITKLMVQIPLSSETSTVLFKDISEILLNTTSLHPQEACMHRLLQMIPEFIQSKTIPEHMIISFKEPLLQFKNINIFYNDVLSLLTDGESIRYPHALYLIFELYQAVDIIEKLMQADLNCVAAQKCGFLTFLSTKLSEKHDLLPLFTQIARISCSIEAVQNFFHLLKTTKSFPFLSQLFDSFLLLLSEKQQPEVLLLSDGLDIPIPREIINHRSPNFSSFVFVQGICTNHILSLKDSKNETTNVSVTQKSVLVQNSLFNTEIPSNQWSSIVVRMKSTDSVIYVESNDSCSLYLHHLSSPNSQSVFVIGNVPFSESKYYNTEMYQVFEVMIKSFTCKINSVIDFNIEYQETPRSFYSQFLGLFRSESLLSFFNLSKEIFNEEEIETYRILKAFYLTIIASPEEQQHFLESKGIQKLAYLLSNLPSKEKTFAFHSLLIQVIQNSKCIEFQKIFVNNIVFGQNIFMSMPSDDHIASLIYIKELARTDPSSILFTHLTIPRILSLISLFYSYQLNSIVSRDPFLDVEKCRSWFLEIIAEESKHSFTENDFTCFVESILYTTEHSLKIGLLKGLAHVSSFSSGIVKSSNYLEPLSKLHTLLNVDNNDATITCLIIEIVVRFSRHFQLPLIDHLSIIEKHIMNHPPSQDLIKMLIDLMDKEEMQELFEMCSCIAVNNSTPGFYNRTITKIERSAFWCVWSCIGMLRDRNKECIYFLSHLNPCFWEDVISCLYILSVSIGIDPRDPILFIVDNMLQEAESKVCNYNNESVSSLLNIASHFIIYGSTQSNNKGLWNLIQESPFRQKITNQESNLFSNSKRDISSVLNQCSDIRTMLGTKEFVSEQFYCLRINEDGKWIDKAIAAKALNLMLIFRCPEHLKLCIVFAMYIFHEDPGFVRNWVQKFQIKYNEELSHNIDLSYYLFRVCINFDSKLIFPSSMESFIDFPILQGSYLSVVKEYQKHLNEERERLTQLSLIIQVDNHCADNAAKRIRAIEIEMGRQRESNTRAWEASLKEPTNIL